MIKEEFSISEENELETILEFAYEINRIDPDIILTKGGDQFLFPHLLYRAKANKVENQLLINLNRESNLEYLLKRTSCFQIKVLDLITCSQHHTSLTEKCISNHDRFFYTAEFTSTLTIHLFMGTMDWRD
ncbi:MAG: hypothetical protein L0H53_14565 [Candidatus Nitrosocosmicus sp.]|nr:hypothetical protein [Candidatus Nitrosocosmicus sp.]